MDASDEREQRFGFTQVICAVAGVILLYVASIGPVFMHTDYLHNREPHWVRVLYEPLAVVCQRLPDPVVNAYDHYIQWWDSLRHP